MPLRPTLHGWLVLDKPLGLTSTQALGRVRKLVGGSKAGHGGTLDPLATGLLPLAFGEATKLIPHIMDGVKEYEFTICWGEARSTDDAEGEVVATHPHRPDVAAIQSALPHFLGVIEQKPPAYSAIKLDGERAYDLARAGEVVDIPARPVEIKSFECLGQPDLDHAAFRVMCGKGTYVRSLARDLAVALGTCGYVSALRRTRVGAFTIEDSITLEGLQTLADQGLAQSALMPIAGAARDLPHLSLLPAEAERLRRGQGVLIRPQHGPLYAEAVILATHQDVPVALVEPAAGEFRVVRGFSY